MPYHPLVEALASDPSQPPKPATRLFGYPGPAADSKSTRLWLDEELSSYVDVPNDAILHSKTLDDDAGTILWVDPTATLTHGSPGAQEVQAEFLGGTIAQRNLAGAAPAAGLGTLEATIATVCRPSLARTACILPTDLGCKVSYNIPCVTRQLPCQSRGFVCISVNVRCPTDPMLCDPIQTLRCISPGVPCIETTIQPESVGVCPPPETGIRTVDTPIVNQIGPFRPQR
ncbi:MAG TPA: hypothetical protein VNC16_01770 [Solirubrobacterales bacterium]|nr:hypothetical protein [Solirubrobacterales bacterium]